MKFFSTSKIGKLSAKGIEYPQRRFASSYLPAAIIYADKGRQALRQTTDLKK
jgi:hypothetical protein